MQSASTPCIILATSARIALMIVRLHALLFQKPSKHVNSQLLIAMLVPSTSNG
jgi:hypothetical protein